ncbi:MAG: N-acetylmuramoyl-L-alanine amidase family protein [Thermovenabulum sp.]|uniref:N-acetylmuramoyl-L-alanine amidase family protein n=1 Tax=Thermovenabulum sp. TaxID=3100335 RepID=UPI003C7CB12A
MKNNFIQCKNKNIIILILILFFCLYYFIFFRISALNVFYIKKSLLGKVIVIDPGHGGIDSGAFHQDGTLEKDINLMISLKLKKALELEGAKVIMTRTTDEALDDRNNKSSSRHRRDLIARTEIINSSGANVFLSIHVNSEKVAPKVRGPMIFYFRESFESKRLAEILQKYLEKAYSSSGHRVPSRNPYPNSSLFLLCNTKIPGVIIEVGFITNAQDRQLLKTSSFQVLLAEEIKNALVEYF